MKNHSVRMMVSLINLRKVEQENNLLPRLNSQFLRTVLNACYIRHGIRFWKSVNLL